VAGRRVAGAATGRGNAHPGDGIVRAKPASIAPVHIVVLAWLYVTFAMALTMPLPAGAAWFALAGLGPVVLWMLLRVRRDRARRRREADAQEARPGG